MFRSLDDFVSKRYKIYHFLPYRMMIKIREMTGIPSVYHQRFDDLEVIFIHIPKAAGSSVGKALIGTDKVGHYPYYMYEIMDLSKFRRYKKFSVVRNPYDRVYSAYNYLMTGGKGDADRKVGEYIKERSSSFEDFCLNVLDENFANRNIHFVPQVKFLFDNKKLMVDRVIKLEQLDDELGSLSEWFGVDLVLPKYNVVNNTGRKPEISSGLKDKLFRIYRDDFDLLSYDK